jgi:hypothetical protein
MSRRLTPEPPLATWIIVGLLVFGFIVFYPAVKQLPLRQLLSEIDLHWLLPDRESEAGVWVSKRSGAYYCVGSQGYRTVKPGEFMTEAHARRRGFHPALNAPCAQKSLNQGIGTFDIALDLTTGRL